MSVVVKNAHVEIVDCLLDQEDIDINILNRYLIDAYGDEGNFIEGSPPLCIAINIIAMKLNHIYKPIDYDKMAQQWDADAKKCFKALVMIKLFVDRGASFTADRKGEASFVGWQHNRHWWGEDVVPMDLFLVKRCRAKYEAEWKDNFNLLDYMNYIWKNAWHEREKVARGRTLKHELAFLESLCAQAFIYMVEQTTQPMNFVDRHKELARVKRYYKKLLARYGAYITEANARYAHLDIHRIRREQAEERLAFAKEYVPAEITIQVATTTGFNRLRVWSSFLDS